MNIQRMNVDDYILQTQKGRKILSESQSELKEKKPDIHAVLFDLGGVILRTEDPAPREELAQRFGFSRYELEEVVFGNPVALKAEAGQATIDEVLQEIGRRLHLAPHGTQEVIQSFFAGDKIDFNLVDQIRRLRPRYKTGLLSNGWRTNLSAYLQNELEVPKDTFDVIISSAACKMAKPDPKIYRLAVNLLEAEPAQVVFVDDNLRNIEAAQAAGLHAIQFINAQQTEEDLAKLIDIPGESSTRS